METARDTPDAACTGADATCATNAADEVALEAVERACVTCLVTFCRVTGAAVAAAVAAADAVCFAVIVTCRVAVPAFIAVEVARATGVVTFCLAAGEGAEAAAAVGACFAGARADVLTKAADETAGVVVEAGADLGMDLREGEGGTVAVAGPEAV